MLIQAVCSHKIGATRDGYNHYTTTLNGRHIGPEAEQVCQLYNYHLLWESLFNGSQRKNKNIRSHFTSNDCHLNEAFFIKSIHHFIECPNYHS